MKGRPLGPVRRRTRTAQSADAVRPIGLLVGQHRGLRARRVLGEMLELRAAGIGEAESRLAEADLVLLDGSLPKATRERLLQAVHARPGPRPVALQFGGAPHALADDSIAVQPPRQLKGRVHAALRLRGLLREHARMDAELVALREQHRVLADRLAEDLRLAARVQRSLLPSPPQQPGLDVAREFIPFRDIGGDCYDFLVLGGGRIAFTIGDVMGKGLPAALLAANLKACVRAQLQSGDLPAAELMSRVNRLFFDVTPTGLFASLFFGVFDLSSRSLEFVNAGHDYPFLVRGASGEVCDLTAGGTVLGLVEGGTYERGSVRFRAGDLAVFYSDGVTDRANVEGEMFGIERLKQAAVRSRRDNARLALYTLLGEVQGWSEGVLAEDDMTLVLVKAV